MASFIIKQPTEYTREIRKFATADLVHADVVNSVINLLVNNDAFLKDVCDLAEVHLKNGNLHVTKELKEKWNEKAEKTLATQTANGLMSYTDKNKLDTVKQNAEENFNTYSSVKVGSTTVTAGSKQGNVEFVAGENIVLTADNSTKKVTIATEGGGNYIGTAPPSKTNLLWTDMSQGGVLKYFNGSGWVPMKAVWG